MREAIHTPVYIPSKMKGGDGYALQEVKLINCTSESPHSYALILRFTPRRGGTENFQLCASLSSNCKDLHIRIINPRESRLIKVDVRRWSR